MSHILDSIVFETRIRNIPHWRRSRNDTVSRWNVDRTHGVGLVRKAEAYVNVSYSFRNSVRWFSAIFPYLPSASLYWIYLFLFLIGATVGPFQPSIRSHAAHTLSVDSTTFQLLIACVIITGVGIAAWLSGKIGKAYDLQTAMLIAPVSFAIMTVLMIWNARTNMNESDEIHS